jgi:hypothetical protein
MTNVLVEKEESASAFTTHEQLTIPLVSGAFAAAAAWVCALLKLSLFTKILIASLTLYLLMFINIGNWLSSRYYQDKNPSDSIPKRNI